MPATKPYLLLIQENKSHRTKKELGQRKLAEEQLYTGKNLKERAEIKENPDAHGEFLRIKKLLTAIGKNDDIFSGPINRYAMLFAECREFEVMREDASRRIDQLEENRDKFAAAEDMTGYFKTLAAMEKHLIDIDKQVQVKRRMMFDLEKENLMTVAAAMRSIAKQPQKKKSKLEEALE